MLENLSSAAVALGALRVKIAAVLSVRGQQPTLVKCSKMASFFEKLIIVVLYSP